MGREPTRVPTAPVSLILVLWALPMFAAVGGAQLSVDVGPIDIYAFKVLVPIAFFVTLLTVRSDLHVPTEAWASVGLTAWALIGALWAPEGAAAFKAATVFAFAAMLFAMLRWWADRWRDQVVGALVTGWRVALLGTALVAAWELATGSHLPTDLASNEADVAGVVLSVFRNPNDYGAFLALAIPLCLFPAGRLRSFSVPIALGSAGLLVLSGSRFGLLAVGLAGVVAMVRFRHRWWTAPSTWVVVAGGTIGFVGLVAVGAKIAAKFTALFLPGAFGNTSAGTRVALIGYGRWAAITTCGIGLGGGGYEVMTTAGDVPIHVRGGDVNPHNMWVEVVSEFGVVGLVLVLILLGAIWGRLRRRGVPEPAATVLWAALASYVVAVCTPSSYLASPVNWMFLATVSVLTLSGTIPGTSTRPLDASSMLPVRRSAPLGSADT